MRKNLFPLFAALAVCGAVTAGIVASTAHAQTGKSRPMMIALVSSAATLESAAPQAEGGPSRMTTPQMAPPPEIRDGARLALMCQDMYARQVGDLAYMGAKLNLTAAQTPLFDHWKQVQTDIAKRRQTQCGTRIAAGARDQMPSMIDQMSREQQMLKTRLADLDAERPALETLYNALSAAQKRQFHLRGEDGNVRMAGMMPRRMFDRGERPDRALEGRPLEGRPMGPQGGPPGPPPQ
jgi:LTXXQ motif family protein